jgi:hypothetical protein
MSVGREWMISTDRVERLTAEWHVEREQLRAEVARFRARVRVEAEDVERVGVTREHAFAWARAHSGYVGRLGVGTVMCIVGYVNSGTWPGKCAFDILDEMAAMPLSSDGREDGSVSP